MKRDINLVRQILLAMESHPSGFAPHKFTIVGYHQDVIGHHVYLMEQAGLITAVSTTEFGSTSPVAQPLTITWRGHDFLDAVRDETVWSKVKIELKDKGKTLPFFLLHALALTIAADLAGSK
jgi:hypothetical protein